MRRIENGQKPTSIAEKTDNRQIHVIVHDSLVKMNFPTKSESPVITEVKRMMMGAAGKMEKNDFAHST